MIITIIFVLMIIIGLIAIKIDKYDVEVLGTLNIVFGVVGLLVCIAIISTQHACAGKIIQTNKLQYDGLCKRLEVVQSDYEDVSKSHVIADITAWNIDVYNTKYWSESLWTNWFNPKDIADNMDYIPLEE